MSNSLVDKLRVIQSRLKAPKTQFNKFGKFNYRSLEDILEAVKPLLNETGTVLTISDKIESLGNSHEGEGTVQMLETKNYITATASITDGTGTISVSASAREPNTKKGMDQSQITGTASSYARKYALNGLFLIDDSKDPDSQDNSGKKHTESESDESNKVDHSTEKNVETNNVNRPSRFRRNKVEA